MHITIKYNKSYMSSIVSKSGENLLLILVASFFLTHCDMKKKNFVMRQYLEAILAKQFKLNELC